MSKKILCFGDSNTWGYAPDGHRYNEQERWPSLLAEHLPQSVCVIEQGQPGRTTRFDYPPGGLASGTEALYNSVKSCKPDLVILMLGTNDLAATFDQSAQQIAANVADLARQLFEGEMIKPSQLILVAPPAIEEIGHFGELFQGGAAKSQQFAQTFAEQANQLGCHFFDAATVITPDTTDGIHWTALQHVRFASGIVQAVGEQSEK
jgi:lysophospholipase L1-like esterase